MIYRWKILHQKNGEIRLHLHLVQAQEWLAKVVSFFACWLCLKLCFSGTFNVDCINGAFCNQRICKCLAGFIHIDSYCWKKVGPEESGCTYDAQCNAVWPDSRCSPAGVCNCPEDQKVALTREGPVCHAENECPTNGANSVLFTRNSNKKAECYFFDRHGQELPGQFMGCEDEPELFDCIEGICCPRYILKCSN
jgi:hypothetical protein